MTTRVKSNPTLLAVLITAVWISLGAPIFAQPTISPPHTLDWARWAATGPAPIRPAARPTARSPGSPADRPPPPRCAGGVMTTGRGIDHIGIASRDLDGLAAQYQALGFTLTPRAYHQDHMGTSNRLVQFRGQNFIELLEVDRPKTMLPHGPGFMGFGQFNHDYLKTREGLSLIIFRTEDTAADLAAWKAKGLGVYDQFNFFASAMDSSTKTSSSPKSSSDISGK